MYHKVVLKLSDFHLYVLVVIGVVTIISLLLGLRWRARFLQMSGMIISMFLGMSVGLTAGVTFGAIYHGSLFPSTILGIVFGIIAGLLCGMSFGLLSAIEGLMSGLMGGMMGAMLGEMISIEQTIVFINIFLLLSLCTIFLLIILSTPTKDTIKNMGWLLKPILTSILIGCVLYLGNSLSMEKVESKSISHKHEQDTNTTPEIHTEVQDIIIETSGMSYSPNEIVVRKNMPVKLVLKNSDQIEHDFEMKTSSFNMIGGSTHQHKVEENVLHLHAEAQTINEITFSMSEVGTYEFYCTIPGHKENGMVGLFVVK